MICCGSTPSQRSGCHFAKRFERLDEIDILIGGAIFRNETPAGKSYRCRGPLDTRLERSLACALTLGGCVPFVPDCTVTILGFGQISKPKLNVRKNVASRLRFLTFD